MKNKKEFYSIFGSLNFNYKKREEEEEEKKASSSFFPKKGE